MFSFVCFPIELPFEEDKKKDLKGLSSNRLDFRKTSNVNAIKF